MPSELNITVVIPTKNRPHDLLQAVQSIIAQSTKPFELLIIDQSEGAEGEVSIRQALSSIGDIALIYVRDPSIAGLVPAKSESLKYATGDLICFLEDDVVLEGDYLAEIKAGFVESPAMLGCCGVVTALAPMPRGYLFFFHFFHRGIFLDPRVGIHGHSEGKGHALISSPTISGGVSAWRKEVFNTIQFDVKNDFFMLEDIDFSTRAERILGTRFYINPNARLDHRSSPLNRAKLPARQRRKIREYIVFYKKRKDCTGAFPALVWLLIGLLIECLFQSIQNKSPSLILNYFFGLIDGCKWKVNR